MAYIPTANDIPSGSYMPTADDIPSVPSEKQQFKYETGMNRTPLDAVRDFASGAIKSLGQGGQFIANKLTGGYAPQGDIQGLANLVKSSNPDANTGTLETIGSYAPYGTAGGPSILGQMAGSFAHGALTANPNQQNAFGYLPTGRLGAGIAESAETGTALKLLPYAFTAAKNILTTIPHSLKNINPKQAAQTVQAEHDALSDSASNIFDTVGSLAKQRNVNTIPNVDKIINNAQEYFPKTKASTALLNDARSGDYDALRKLQSDLFYRGNKNKVSPLASERDAGDEMLDVRDDINNAISNHFKNTGNQDLDNLLNTGKQQYANLKKTYYTHPTISKLVNPEIRKVPKNILNVFAEDSVPMQRLRKSNPTLAKTISDMTLKQNAINRLKYLGAGAGIVGGAATGIDELKRLFTHDNQ